MHLIELQDLVCAMLGIDIDKEAEARGEDFDDWLEEQAYEKLGIEDYAHLEKLVNRLLPLVTVGTSPLTNTVYRGFAKDGVWLVKQEVNHEKKS